MSDVFDRFNNNIELFKAKIKQVFSFRLLKTDSINKSMLTYTRKLVLALGINFGLGLVVWIGSAFSGFSFLQFLIINFWPIALFLAVLNFILIFVSIRYPRLRLIGVLLAILLMAELSLVGLTQANKVSKFSLESWFKQKESLIALGSTGQQPSRLWFLLQKFQAQKDTRSGPSPTATLSSTAQSTDADCNEQQALAGAKNCTYLVETNLGHGSAIGVADQYLLTNKHVVNQAEKILTWVAGNQIEAQLWNADPDADLAVLYVETGGLNVCQWGDSHQIKLAATLYAVGWPNSSKGDSSITRGIFSRYIQTEQGPEFIQTDAAINPGNSGGSLVNQCGVIGVNTAKIAWSQQNVPAEGFSFAIAGNYVQSVLPELIQQGEILTLPVIFEMEEYSLEEEYGSQSGNNGSNNQAKSGFAYIDPAVKQSWLQARDVTREMQTYWTAPRPDVDQSRLEDLKDLLARMSAVVETVIPKIENNQPLSPQEQQLLEQWNSMYRHALLLEEELHNQDYSHGYYHYQCENNACVAQSGRGKNSCSAAADCAPEYHYECQQMACMVVEGKGENECTSHDDCYYFECKDSQCKKAAGDGVDECYWDWQCQ